MTVTTPVAVFALCKPVWETSILGVPEQYTLFAPAAILWTPAPSPVGSAKLLICEPESTTVRSSVHLGPLRIVPDPSENSKSLPLHSTSGFATVTDTQVGPAGSNEADGTVLYGPLGDTKLVAVSLRLPSTVTDGDVTAVGVGADIVTSGADV